MADNARKRRLTRKEVEGTFQELVFNGLADQYLEDEEAKKKVAEAYKRLKIEDPSAAEVLDKLCGLTSNQPISASDLARSRQVTRSNISRLKRRGVEKLRRYLSIRYFKKPPQMP
jgi:DNA-directed RNA polymerase sigma subunit (sigma70/sigma32)